MQTSNIKITLAVLLLTLTTASSAGSLLDFFSFKTSSTETTPAKQTQAACPLFGIFGCDNQASTTDAVAQEAPCPRFDVFDCKKGREEQAALKQQQMQAEAIYQNQLQIALSRRAGQAQEAWYANSAESACQEAAFKPGSENSQRCVVDVERKYQDLKNKLRAGSEKIVSCREWAIAKGAKWESAQADMQLESQGEMVTPIMFSGEVSSGNKGSLTIKHYGDNACVSIKGETLVLQRASLNIGKEIRGYGMQTGQQMVAMVDGQKIRIPVIEAACLE